MIHYDIPMPELSPDFTLADIRKIREWNYERMKDATVAEQVEYYRQSWEETQAEMEKFRKERASNNDRQ